MQVWVVWTARDFDYKLYHNIHFNLSRFKAQSANSSFNCLDECSRDSNCIAITYSSKNRICSFYNKKDSNFNFGHSICSFSYLKGTLELNSASSLFRYSLYKSVQYYKEVNTKSHFDCSKICSDDLDCIVNRYSELNSNSSNCYFYNCNFMYSPEECPIYQVYSNFRLGNHYKKEGVTESVLDCWHKCVNDAECIAVSFSSEAVSTDCLFYNESLYFEIETNWTIYSKKELPIYIYSKDDSFKQLEICELESK